MDRYLDVILIAIPAHPLGIQTFLVCNDVGYLGVTYRLT